MGVRSRGMIVDWFVSLYGEGEFRVNIRDMLRGWFVFVDGGG